MSVRAAAAAALRPSLRHLRGESWLSGPRDARWWTARKPVAGAPGFGDDGRVRALPALDVSKLTRESVQRYMDNAWLADDTLFAALDGEEAFLAPPWHDLRRPQVFYYGHSAAFYVNVLVRGGVLADADRVDPSFERIFEAGVDEQPGDDMSINRSLWPAVADVLAYRREVHALVSRVIEREVGPLQGARVPPVDSAHPLWALLMTIEHQRVHTETSSVLFREMPTHLLQPSLHFAPVHPSAQRPCASPTPREGVDFRPAQLLPNRGGHVELGRRGEPEFGWDLEYGRRVVDVPPFEICNSLVSNGEFHRFVAEGGYARERYWPAEGWAWREAVGASAPQFWAAGGGLRLLLSKAPMQWDWPVVVNRHEAMAYCAWRSEVEDLAPPVAYRPPTEAELALLRAQNAAQAAAAGAADDGLGDANGGLRWSSEAPVDAMRAARTGHHDLLGNVWQHCTDEAAPLDGFEPHRLYPAYSEPMFDGRHFILTGGSFATGGAFCSARTRNYFRPHFFQHAGFRLARTLR
ncbi:hypothetical protein KFE25_000309 [Diacronema lutheri]|uniref:Sulfatase-modifying factor enzyme-like domain-containing protein n=1 Tax=Diacronema lutheri TaxID=2081491 RepID=A0A8J6C454_DIALT|nr:hypothetical protein KFE25_010441 [Diacronema lutheri]KAG8464141.1 hypothetical protein KFE25_000309 [Diacronema lutheri]